MADNEKLKQEDERLTAVSKAVFDAVDRDRTGHLGRAELKLAMTCITREAGIEPPSEEQVDEAMQYLDTDRSGTIELEEFKELMRQVLEVTGG